MSETPDGGVHMQGTRDDMFDHLRENRDTRCIGLQFPGLGCRVLVKVSASAPADDLLYDIIVLCQGDGDPGHEEHPVDGRELQTRQEIEELLDGLHRQEQLHQLMAMLGMAEMN